MKNPERVAELLAALKAECEYRFEFDTVDKLAQAISELPRVTVIDDRHQEFCGKHFTSRRDGYFYARFGEKMPALHRVVWSHYFGEIPKGYIVHHIDGDKNNNNIENLRLVSHSEHTQIHNSDIPKKIFVCQYCGKKFKGRDNRKNYYCSVTCNKKAWCASHRVKKICAYCGKPFTSHREQARFCSKSCAMKYRWEKD